jgi:hypothetical protein
MVNDPFKVSLVNRFKLSAFPARAQHNSINSSFSHHGDDDSSIPLAPLILVVLLGLQNQQGVRRQTLNEHRPEQ